MATYIFTGRLIPERAEINVNPVKISFVARVAGFQGEMTISIASSQICIRLETRDIDVNPDTMRNYVEYTARTLVDLYGFTAGNGYYTELSYVVDPQGQQTVLTTPIKALKEIEMERPLPFQKLLPVMVKSHLLPRVLEYLREAVRSPFDTGFMCYSAIDTIRKNFVKEDDYEENQSWERMLENLRIDAGFISGIQDYTKSQGSIGPMYMLESERRLILEKCWKIVYRYCIYIMDNYQTLSSAEFNLLKEEE
jgi:hypothetical protein